MVPMQFNDILDIHSAYTHEHAHADILGDGFLLQNNPVYRSARRLSLEIGCRYVEAYPRYLLLPFHELPKIVVSKEVPYVPHARLMQEIESDRPNAFSLDEVPMPESYHLHESAHVIAEHFFGGVQVESQEGRILNAILCESVANTVDALTCMPAHEEIHRLFVKQNCYMQPQKKIIEAMSRLVTELGFQFTFMLTYFTYVQANFLSEPLSDERIRGLLAEYVPGAPPNAKTAKDIQIVRGIGEKLDPRFRVNTTANYLKQQGFEGDLQDLLGFDFQAVFTANPKFKSALHCLCRQLG